MKTMNYNSTRIAIPTSDGIEIYDCSEILRCQADKTCSFVFLSDGTHVVSTKSLKHFESVLKAYDFIRIHKANLINIFHVRKYTKGKRSHVVLSDSSSVEVASRKKNHLLRVISSFPFKGSISTITDSTTTLQDKRKEAIKSTPRLAAERKTPKMLVRKSKGTKTELLAKRRAS